MITYEDVSLQQEGHSVLEHVNLRVEENDFIYITGRVGSGKSTLLKSLYAELPIESGEATVLGHNLRKLKTKHLPALRRELGVVFQNFRLIDEMTVEQNLRFVLRATGWKRKACDARIEEVLQAVGLQEKRPYFPHELSGGEQQRVCIARALLNHPKVILADEPTGNLDAETTEKIMQILFTARDQGSAVVMVTHNLNLISNHPGIVYRCENGTISDVTLEYNKAIELDMLEPEAQLADTVAHETAAEEVAAAAEASQPATAFETPVADEASIAPESEAILPESAEAQAAE